MGNLQRVGAVLLTLFTASVALADEPRTIRVWLLPAERGVNSDITDVRELDRQIDEFETKQVPNGVVLENTHDPVLRAQLLAWNPAFAMPNFGWVRGQTTTLAALARFGKANGLQVSVRFNTWANALPELLRAATEHNLPDIAQVGSTWISFLVSSGLITPGPARDQGDAWRDLRSVPHASLRYLFDLRLIFYWQESPSGPPWAEPFLLDSSSWATLVDSLGKSPGPALAMPIGLTYNVEHDLFPLLAADPASLFTMGRWTNRVDLSQKEISSTLNLLADRSIIRDQRGYPHRLIAFPEVTHEEAIRSFESGGFIALIEPIGYLSRWHASFQEQHPGTDFWRLAGIAAPPTGILGGSDLAVMRDSQSPSQAFELARFLSTDPEYTDVLTRLGNLPAYDTDRAVDRLVESVVGAARPDASRQIGREVRLALRRSKEYPPMEAWAEHVESQSVLESAQRLWRRVAEQDTKRVDTALEELQHTINARIDPRTILADRVALFWRQVSILVGLTLIGVTIFARRTARMLQRVRKVRGFSSAALATLDSVHERFNPFRRTDGDKEEAQKAAAISVGLLGLRRGLEDRIWKPQRVREIAWRAIVSAMDSIRDVTLSRKWQQQVDRQPPEVFLSNLGLLRPTAEFASGDPPFFFSFDVEHNILVPLPILMEQALTCLIQNALKASKKETASREAYYLPIEIRIRRSALTVSNELRPDSQLCPEILTLINSSRNMADFEKRVLKLLEGPPADRPGIGLVEAYSIASECYGGLSVAIDHSTVSFTIRLERTWTQKLSQFVAAVRDFLGASRKKATPMVEAHDEGFGRRR